MSLLAWLMPMPKKVFQEYIEILEKRYAYLRENFELELDKKIKAYSKDAHVQLTKEVEYWQEKAESLQREINRLNCAE